MPSQFIQFLDVGLNPLMSNVRFKPWNPPFTTGSTLIMGDTRTLTTDVNGYVSASLADGYYEVKILTTFPETIAFGLVTGGNYTPFSASIPTGSASTIVFNLDDILTDPYSYKAVKITPVDENVYFSGSVIGSGYTSSFTDVNGSVTFNDMVPGVKLVQALSSLPSVYSTHWYIDVPSTGLSYNASTLRVYGYSAAIPVQLNPADNSYVYSISASNELFALKSQVNCISASYAQTASFALNGGSTITDIDGGNASSNYGGVIQSPIFGGNA